MKHLETCAIITLAFGIVLLVGNQRAVGQETEIATESETGSEVAVLSGVGGPPIPPVTPNCARSYYGKWYGVHYYEAQVCPDAFVYDMGWSQELYTELPCCTEGTGICDCPVETATPTPLTPTPEAAAPAIPMVTGDWDHVIAFLEKAEVHLQRIIDHAPNGNRKAAAVILHPRVVDLIAYLQDSGHSNAEKEAEVRKLSNNSKQQIIDSLMVRHLIGPGEWATAWDIEPSQADPYLFDHSAVSSDDDFTVVISNPPFNHPSRAGRTRSHVNAVYQDVTSYAVRVTDEDYPEVERYYRLKRLIANFPFPARYYRIGQQVKVPEGEEHFIEGKLEKVGRFHQVISIPRFLGQPEKFLVTSYDPWPEE